MDVSFKRIKASSMIEAIVSVAIISAMLLIIFPFFGQVLKTNHRMEIMRGLNLIQLHQNDSLIMENEEFSAEGVAIRKTRIPHSEIPDLCSITTEIVNANKKVVYSITEMKYNIRVIE